MIIVLDYGMGNLRSVQKVLERIGQTARISDRPEDVAGADRLVVPGVGAFSDAMSALRERGLAEAIREFVQRGRPLLGICLGLQVFFEESEETASGGASAAEGLGLLAGRVVQFGDAVRAQGLKVPHMGWNAVQVVRPSALFYGMAEGGVYFYFAHSYYAVPADPEVVTGRTEYGVSFTSAVASGNVLATQFHPEKSQAAGLRVLENFATRT